VAPTELAFDAPALFFGDGARRRLPGVLADRGIETPLVVSDEGVAAAGVLETALTAVDAATPAGRYWAPTEPGTDDVDPPAVEFDGVLAVGGGSVIDTAKLLALLAAHGGTPADYLGVDAVPGPVAPLVAVPTTSGTGSQATQTVVLAHEGIKRGISDEHLRPDAAVVDPELTFDLPAEGTARSGFDALVHALESLTARAHTEVPARPFNYQGANPVSRPLSRRALGDVWDGLEPAVSEGDRDARRSLSLGAHLAGLAFSNAGLGMVHALASTVGGLTGAAHGDCLAVSLRPGLRYNRPVREAAYADLARSLGLANAADDGAAAEALVDGLDGCRSAVGLPGSFADLGLGADDVDRMVRNTLVQDRRLATNPRPADREALTEVLRAAVG